MRYGLSVLLVLLLTACHSNSSDMPLTMSMACAQLEQQHQTFLVETAGMTLSNEATDLEDAFLQDGRLKCNLLNPTNEDINAVVSRTNLIRKLLKDIKSGLTH